MMGLLQDVKFGFRMMARSPWFTSVAVLTLALGIGVNSVGFSIANGVWWKRMPFRNPQEIVTIAISDGSIDADLAKMSYPEFNDIRSRAQSFKNMAAVERAPIVLTNEGDFSERYSGGRITPNLFGFMGVKPIRGRDFGPDDIKPGAPKVVLISHDIWQTRYGGRDDVLGRAVRVDTEPATIVGVMPPRFKFPYVEKVWTPLMFGGNQARNNRRLDVFARLAPGVRIEEARSEVKGIAQAMARDYPNTNKGYDAVVLTLLNWVAGPEQNTAIIMLFGAAGFVLLIACGNVANLLLSRSVQRSREIAVRTALGASRWRIIRQVLIESVMLSFLGGFIGLLFSVAWTRWFDQFLASDNYAGMPFWMNFELDYRVFAYFLVSCIATGIAFGSLPAFQISKTNMNDHLKEGGRQTTGGFRARRMATILLVAEIAMTVTLLVQAGLFMRGFLRVTQTEIGIDTRHLILANLDLPRTKYSKDTDRIAFVDALMERLKKPGRSATLAWESPLGGTIARPLKLQDHDIADKNGKLPNVGTLPVETGYFSTLDVKLIRGRDFQPSDGHPGAEAAIVNERFAARYWPSENPIGKRIRIGDEKSPWLNVIGVSSDVFQGNFLSELEPVVYVPYRQYPVSGFSILVRGTESDATIAADLRSELAKMDLDLALYHLMSFDEQWRVLMWVERAFGTIFSALSLMALVMSSVGLYGVTAHGVSQRTQEIGIRVALGATPLGVVRLVLKQSLVRIAAGLAIGLVGAGLAADYFKRALFPEVGPRDPLTFLSVSALMAAVTLLACVIPAWRAARLNPSDALRTE